MKKKGKDPMIDLHRLLSAQEFNTEDEVRAYLDKILVDGIPNIPPRELSDKEKAEDLVHDAYDLDAETAREYAAMALTLDRDCIEAYELLAGMESAPQIAIVFFEKGVSIGRRLFGGEYMKRHKGMFWGFHETRPFMRCMQNYADCLYTLGYVEECVAILEEMIELNSEDNQGVRDQLLLYLVQLNEDKKFLKYAKKYKDDGLAFALFTRALFAYKTEGETENANQKLAEALAQNKFVAKLLLANKPLTEFHFSFEFGGKDEAEYYAVSAQSIWAGIPGAKEWLKKHSEKSKGKK
jgi:tetratricopeptide (TPR) repeat protein